MLFYFLYDCKGTRAGLFILFSKGNQREKFYISHALRHNCWSRCDKHEVRTAGTPESWNPRFLNLRAYSARYETQISYQGSFRKINESVIIILTEAFSTVGFILGMQFSSVAQSRSVLCYPMDCSMPSFPVHHQLLELTQTHVHQVGDAIQPSHPLWSPSPTTFNLSQEQGLFKWVGSSYQVAKGLEFQLQHQSSSGLISFKTDWLDLFPVQGTLRVFSNTIVQKHQFFSTQLSL